MEMEVSSEVKIASEIRGGLNQIVETLMKDCSLTRESAVLEVTTFIAKRGIPKPARSNGSIPGHNNLVCIISFDPVDSDPFDGWVVVPDITVQSEEGDKSLHLAYHPSRVEVSKELKGDGWKEMHLKGDSVNRLFYRLKK